MFWPSTNLVLASFNWRTLTASVSLTPSSTLVICLLPALIPSLVMDGPLLITKPPLVILVSPILTEPSWVRSILFFNANSTLAPSSLLVCFTVTLLPPENSTVLPSVIFLAAVSEPAAVLPVDLTLKLFIVPRPEPLIVISPFAVLDTVIPSAPFTFTLPPLAGTSVPLAWIVQSSSVLAIVLSPYLMRSPSFLMVV